MPRERWFTQREILEMFHIHRQTLNWWRRFKIIKYKKRNQRVFFYRFPIGKKTWRQKEIDRLRFDRWKYPELYEMFNDRKQSYEGGSMGLFKKTRDSILRGIETKKRNKLNKENKK